MSIASFGATVIGPAHKRAGVGNQDAWAQVRVGAARVVAVADGLGSRSEAATGSRAACAAVPDAVRAWLRFPQSDLRTLIAFVHLFWRARLGRIAPEDAATTCLFALVHPDGSGLVAQLGDGLILIRNGEEVLPLTSRPADAFSNSTDALGITHNTSSWHTRLLPPGPSCMVLCTDGVSDDLLPDTYADFLNWLSTDIGTLKPSIRSNRLRGELNAWPTPHHQDDKTLAFITSSP